MSRAPTVLLALLLAGCGFHLRGSVAVPFDTLYIPNAKSGIALELKRNIEAGTSVKVVDDPKTADAVLELAGENREKIILSLTGTGRVREFRLRYTVNYRVYDGKGVNYVPATLVQLTRDVTYNDSDILAKETEEQLLFRDMQSDMVQQVMRRLAAIERVKPKAQ
ncbi:MAG TPA: LPS assembly lipoprotein LptE [Burkholderiales bacterium]|jgi:LPS-assembly lipoprotein|nr:LPS assembly lipoprotein LptE [Burkholderiales bacterium]